MESLLECELGLRWEDSYAFPADLKEESVDLLMLPCKEIHDQATVSEAPKEEAEPVATPVPVPPPAPPMFSKLNRTSGHWRNEERQLYHLFLELCHEQFLRKEMRRADKIFKKMALFIGTRAADQCRSHHQKCEKKFGSLQGILLSQR